MVIFILHSHYVRENAQTNGHFMKFPFSTLAWLIKKQKVWKVSLEGV